MESLLKLINEGKIKRSQIFFILIVPPNIDVVK